MYTIDVRIRGTTPLLQHKFAPTALDTLMDGASKRTGAPDYSLEWIEAMYVTADGYLCQPATHIEGALVRAGGVFKVKGKSGKTWKDAMRAYCYVQPHELVHQRSGAPVKAPGPDLLTMPMQHLSVNIMRVIINRSAVARSRLMIGVGWELVFTIEVHDEQLRFDIVRTILEEAGRSVGIGDFRPRYGRFEVVTFAPHSSG